MMTRYLVALFFGIWGLSLPSTFAMGGETDHSVLHAAHSWTKETIPGTKNGAIYLTIHNPGTEMDRLIGVARAIAEKVEIHESSKVDGVARMSRLTSIDLPAGEHVVFKPGGGPHVMLIDLISPLKAGDVFKLTLTFEGADDFDLEVPVITMAEAMEKTGHDPSHHSREHHEED